VLILLWLLIFQVAKHLYKQDPVRVYAKVEIGIDVDELTSPWLAAISSALSFSVGALIAILSAAYIRDYVTRLAVLTATCTVALAGFGMLSANLGGAPWGRAAVRVVLGGWIALLVSYIVLHYFNQA
jgi:VIT1/CCC1 family predicted Fe2+/Mn2+ transporter